MGLQDFGLNTVLGHTASRISPCDGPQHHVISNSLQLKTTELLNPGRPGWKLNRANQIPKSGNEFSV
jgi:hypothetical protein